jgi:hypothetical protein
MGARRSRDFLRRAEDCPPYQCSFAFVGRACHELALRATPELSEGGSQVERVRAVPGIESS